MTLSNEPAPNLDPSSLPGDPAAYRRRGPGRNWWLIIGGVAVWTVLTIAGTLYILSLARPAPAAPETHPAVAVAGFPFVHTTLGPPPAPAPASEPAPADTVAAVSPPLTSSNAPAQTAIFAGRLQKVEVDQHRTSEAAAATLAAASLAEAAQSGAPFDGELTAISHLLPPSVDLRTLQRLSGQGAPTRAALAAEFGDIAAGAAVAARTPPKGSGFLARAGHVLAGIITIRRVDHVTGSSADAVLARAQTELASGDLEHAVAELDKLPAPAKQALASWRARAQRRLDIDRQISAIRVAALHELSQSAGQRP